MLRPRLKSGFCALFTFMTVLTVVWPTWIEGLTGVEPDGRSGTTEWAGVLMFAVIALVLGLLARHDYQLAVLREGLSRRVAD